MQNITQLKAYLGLLSYYSRFLPHLPTTLAPLYKLLRKNQKWQWNQQKEKAFIESKQLLTSDEVLTYFNAIIVACDCYCSMRLLL